MKDSYLTNIKNLIERNIIEQTKHQIKSNSHKLMTYHNIGKELVEAEKDVENKYGAGIVKNYAKKLKEEYGSGFDTKNLHRMRQFYLYYPKVVTLSRLSWSHLITVFPIKDENKRNYYLNSAIEHCMGVRKLREYIKSNAYERLIDKENINLKYLEDQSEFVEPDIMSMIKNPILISLNKSVDKLSEKIIKELVLEQMEKFMIEAGVGFAFMGSEKPIKLDGKNHYVDLVFFNVKLNCYVIMELKLNDLKKADIGQIEFYVRYYDDVMREAHHNPTIGITISKSIDPNLDKYTSKPNVKHTTYQLLE